MKKVLLLLSFVSLACFGQLDITKRTVNLDSINGRRDTIWTNTNVSIYNGVEYDPTNPDSARVADTASYYNETDPVFLASNAPKDSSRIYDIIVDCDNLHAYIIANNNGVLDCNNLFIYITAKSNQSDVIYSWDGSISGDLGTSNPLLVLIAETITLTTTNTITGCTYDTSIVITIDVTTPQFEIFKTSLLNDTLFISSFVTNQQTGREYSYLWSGTGITTSTSTQFVGVKQAGTFHLVVTDVNTGCNDNDDIVIYNDDFVYENSSIIITDSSDIKTAMTTWYRNDTINSNTIDTWIDIKLDTNIVNLSTYGFSTIDSINFICSTSGIFELNAVLNMVWQSTVATEEIWIRVLVNDLEIDECKDHQLRNVKTSDVWQMVLNGRMVLSPGDYFKMQYYIGSTNTDFELPYAVFDNKYTITMNIKKISK